MSNMSAMEAKKLAAMLGDEKALLEEFLSLTHRQTELLASEDLEGFGVLLDKRRDLIGKIDEIKQELDAAGKGKADAEVTKLRSDIHETLREIEKVSNANRETLKKLMTQLGDEIKKLTESQKLLEGYGQSALGASSEYFDKRF